jgi:hypothetical protein
MAPSSRSRREPAFEICTFVRDDAQYAAMRSSFVGAGFTAELATFTRLDDRGTAGLSREPFAAITLLGGADDPPFAILCHQDVRLDQGYGASELISRLEQLDALDPAWTVAGNAGGALDMRVVRRLVDPIGGSTAGPFPVRVASLDENFLVLNRIRAPSCSGGLDGFHLYGTDVCLNALAAGGSAYVIDFPLTHLSGGAIDSSYYEIRQRFLEVWNPRHRFLYLRTPNELLFISRSKLLRRVFGSSRGLSWARAALPPVVLDDASRG